MANIAGLLKEQLATPERILYRHFTEGGWRDVSARAIAGYAARWQAFLRTEGLAQGERIALCLKNGIHWVAADQGDRKSTRLNSSHLGISYAVFCLKKKKKK